jgi:hypothetical protein
MEKGYLNLKNILFKFRIFIYCFIGVIFGSCLGAYIDYVRHPELYVSSPWYSSVLYIIPLDYPRNRADLKREDIVLLREELIKKLRQEEA